MKIFQIQTSDRYISFCFSFSLSHSLVSVFIFDHRVFHLFLHLFIFISAFSFSFDSAHSPPGHVAMVTVFPPSLRRAVCLCVCAFVC